MQLLLHLERHDRLPVQSLLRTLHLRTNQGRLLHYLQERRQGLLRHAASLLRLPGGLLCGRMQLLHLAGEHADLLLHLLELLPTLSIDGRVSPQGRHSAVVSLCNSQPSNPFASIGCSPY